MTKVEADLIFKWIEDNKSVDMGGAIADDRAHINIKDLKKKIKKLIEPEVESCHLCDEFNKLPMMSRPIGIGHCCKCGMPTTLTDRHFCPMDLKPIELDPEVIEALQKVTDEFKKETNDEDQV